MTAPIVVSTFYKFVPLPDFREMQSPLLDFCKSQDVYGTILLAEEGINATIAGSRESVDAVLAHLREDDRLHDLTTKESFTETVPFGKMKVRLKQEIVRLKMPDANPNYCVGTYVEPKAWNDLISDPDVVVIDTRNDYETRIGTFKGAVNPQTDSFHELPQFVEQQLDPSQHKKVAMFCTGGIRCEKATSYLLQQGFEQVFHLKGGILQYLEDVPADESLWEGECFVFDERVSVDHDLEPGTAILCDACGALLPDADTPCSHCDR